MKREQRRFGGGRQGETSELLRRRFTGELLTAHAAAPPDARLLGSISEVSDGTVDRYSAPS